ncbi:hypothetical protein P3454_26140, partial [Vibrio parahaemolyticus]|nr:hypothetical protein [Vibrio parahaemolyticus]
LELEHTLVHVDPEHPKHTQWVIFLMSLHAINQSINQSINFIYKAQYHKSQFASQGFTAYDIPLSLGPSQRIRKNSPKKTL